MLVPTVTSVIQLKSESFSSLSSVDYLEEGAESSLLLQFPRRYSQPVHKRKNSNFAGK